MYKKGFSGDKIKNVLLSCINLKGVQSWQIKEVKKLLQKEVAVPRDQAAENLLVLIVILKEAVAKVVIL